MTPHQVAHLFGEIVEADDIAVDDNFFDVGGNSVLALQLIAGLTERSGLSLRLIDVVREPTPEGLARTLADRAGARNAGQP
ncbi:phosphopantetheine-binding protein [Streptomyces sp. NPDC048291]|uniref:phosphopantetheine-binding protein n=1 Tax=Streptomyces sp. NPDC048291 TaxID=3365530 RepID=UPI0037186F5E